LLEARYAYVPIFRGLRAWRILLLLLRAVRSALTVLLALGVVVVFARGEDALALGCVFVAGG
jgi:hypothetical protein